MAQYWKEHYDIRYYLEKNWYQVGPQLVDRLHVNVGDADNFFLDSGVHKLQEVDEHHQGSAQRTRFRILRDARPLLHRA
jgi:hypothetical protein